MQVILQKKELNGFKSQCYRLEASKTQNSQLIFKTATIKESTKISTPQTTTSVNQNKEDKPHNTTHTINPCQKQDLFNHLEACRMKDSRERFTEDMTIVCNHKIVKQESCQMLEK